MKKITSLTVTMLLLTSSSLMASYGHEEAEERGGVGAPVSQSIHEYTYENLIAQKFKDYPPALRDHLMGSMPLADSIKWLQRGSEKSTRDAALASKAEIGAFESGIVQQKVAGNLPENKSLRILESQIKEVLTTRENIYDDLYRGTIAVVPFEKQLKVNYDLLAQYGKTYVELMSKVAPDNQQYLVTEVNGLFNNMMKRLVDSERTREQYQKALNDRVRQVERLERLKTLHAEIDRDMEALKHPPAAPNLLPVLPEPPAASKSVLGGLSSWWSGKK
jgi:hypothetical protein